jgi:hypothetical protein
MLPNIVLLASAIAVAALVPLTVWSRRAPTQKTKRRRTLASAAAILPFSWFIFLTLTSGCERVVSATTDSELIYTQDHRHAVKVTDSSQGALGGSSYITLYIWRGLIRNLIFVGDYGSTRSALVSWNGNKALTVKYYEGGPHRPSCKGSVFVSVHCESIPFQPYSK